MTTANSFAIDDLLRRICAEYTEMPGLRVTYQQAQRLWGLDPSTCHDVLDRLVQMKFLTVNASGQYARLTEGPTAAPELRMGRATLDRRALERLGDRQAG